MKAEAVHKALGEIRRKASVKRAAPHLSEETLRRLGIHISVETEKADEDEDDEDE